MGVHACLQGTRWSPRPRLEAGAGAARAPPPPPTPTHPPHPTLSLQGFREDGLLSDSAGMYGMDWFEGALARPGEVLKDVVRAVQPALVPQVRCSDTVGLGRFASVATAGGDQRPPSDANTDSSDSPAHVQSFPTLPTAATAGAAAGPVVCVAAQPVHRGAPRRGAQRVHHAVHLLRRPRHHLPLCRVSHHSGAQCKAARLVCATAAGWRSSV